MTAEPYVLDRSSYIGSSDAPKIAGVSTWGSPLSVWLEKVGMAESKPSSLRMWLGEKLEPIVHELYVAKTGRNPERVCEQDGPPILHPDYPFIGAHPDYDHLECKTTQYASGWGDDMSLSTVADMNMPIDYFVQVQHQLAVMRWDWEDLAVLIGHDDIRRYRVEADADVISNLIAREVQLWNENVLTGEPPEEGDEAARKAYLRKLYRQDIGEPLQPPRIATDEDLEVLDAWRAAKRAFKEAEAQVDISADAVKGIIGSTAGLIGEATWTWTKGRKRLDESILREQLSAIDRLDILATATSRGEPYPTLRDKR